MGTLRAYVGGLFKELRRAAGLTQDELARRIGWNTPKLVSEYEAGRRNATLDTVERILGALKVTRYDVVLRAPKPRRSEESRPEEEAVLSALRRTEGELQSLTVSVARTILRWSRRRRRGGSRK